MNVYEITKRCTCECPFFLCTAISLQLSPLQLNPKGTHHSFHLFVCCCFVSNSNATATVKWARLMRHIGVFFNVSFKNGLNQFTEVMGCLWIASTGTLVDFLVHLQWLASVRKECWIRWVLGPTQQSTITFLCFKDHKFDGEFQKANDVYFYNKTQIVRGWLSFPTEVYAILGRSPNSL